MLPQTQARPQPAPRSTQTVLALVRALLDRAASTQFRPEAAVCHRRAAALVARHRLNVDALGAQYAKAWLPLSPTRGSRAGYDRNGAPISFPRTPTVDALL